MQEEIQQTKPFRTPQEEAALSVLRTADVLRGHFSTVLEPRGLTVQQYNVLRILRGASPEALPTMEIAQRMLEKTPGITRFIDRLERKGFVERQRSAEDRRRVYCSITPAGLQLLDELDGPMASSDDALAMLSAFEVDLLIDLLARIRTGNPAA